MMNAIIGMIKTLFGLFFDDGSLAVAIIGLLVALALLAHAGLLVSPVITMVLLVGGTLLLLLENVIRTAARASRAR
jgi:dolichol kinase